jgi:hypothetical protein
MMETFASLLFAHALADFVLQSDAMVARKGELPVLLQHAGVVLVTAALALGSLDGGALAILAAVHLVIDDAKLRLGRGTLTAVLADQLAHLVSLILLTALVPDLWGRGLWSGLTPLPALMMLMAGAILAVRAGQFVVQLLMGPLNAELTVIEAARPADPASPSESLAEGGKLIGLLERALIFVLVIMGQAAAIGFLIAAKSVLRFGSVGHDRALSEYVIIGTLASFGWAIAVGFFTLVMLNHLSPLGIGLPKP